MKILCAKSIVSILAALTAGAHLCAGDAAAELPKPVAPYVIDDVYSASDYTTDLHGYIGGFMQVNLEKRLLPLDTEAILEPFVHRPGKQEWMGEHAGKFLHAATLVWQATGDARLKAKLDSFVLRFLSTQKPDGYLGTYLEKDYWTSWDLWSHKYDLMGLLTYYRATGSRPALEASRQIGNLLVQTYGPGKKRVEGLAATSIMEGIVLLYRYTGERQFLDLARFIAEEYTKKSTFIAGLVRNGNVVNADPKAYEMMSNLVGFLELYRYTGEKDYLTACENAWSDIVRHRLYPTGTTSFGEYFLSDGTLPPDGKYNWNTKFSSVGEGCVTVTWMQLNLQLFRLSGDVKYLNQLETTTYNALLAAESPQDGKICYFTPLTGRKRYGEVSHGIPGICCCSSSIPRGIALISQFVAGTVRDQPAVLMYIPGKNQIQFTDAGGANAVDLDIATAYPVDGKVDLTINPAREGVFELLLRVPASASQFKAFIGDERYTASAGQMLGIKRAWRKNDILKIELSTDYAFLPDNNPGSDKIVVKRGPQVLAFDEMFAHTPNLVWVRNKPWLDIRWIGNQLYELHTRVNGADEVLRLVPFSDAGQLYSDYTCLLEKRSMSLPSPENELSAYRAELAVFRKEYGGTDSLPKVDFFLFGMGSRAKMIYKDAVLKSTVTGQIIRQWPVTKATILPDQYTVHLTTETGKKVRIFEDEEAVFIDTDGVVEMVEQTRSNLNLPSFTSYAYSAILRELHHEILINISGGEPLPNYFVYKKPWLRDGAMMGLCLKASGNLSLIRDWILNLQEPFDGNNGVQEADNLGQSLFLVSLVSDSKHPLVGKILAELPKFEKTDELGHYISGSTDGAPCPVYQTKWLKYGLRALGLPDPYNIPDTKDQYSSLFWMDYKNFHRTGHDSRDYQPNHHYEYLSWAADHFYGTKKSKISDQDYPLTWEIDAGAANYGGNAVIDDVLVKAKAGVPHTWHAAEVFLYLLEQK